MRTSLLRRELAGSRPMTFESSKPMRNVTTFLVRCWILHLPQTSQSESLQALRRVKRIGGSALKSNRVGPVTAQTSACCSLHGLISRKLFDPLQSRKGSIIRGSLPSKGIRDPGPSPETVGEIPPPHTPTPSRGPLQPHNDPSAAIVRNSSPSPSVAIADKKNCRMCIQFFHTRPHSCYVRVNQ